MNKLPVEMISRIISHLPSADELRNVCLVSKDFRSIATMHIFNHCQLLIKLPDADDSLGSFATQLGHFRGASRQPMLRRVRHFALEVLPCRSSLKGYYFDSRVAFVVDGLVALLSQMSSLKTMSLSLRARSIFCHPYSYMELMVLAEVLLKQWQHLDELELNHFCMEEAWILLRPLACSSRIMHMRLRKFILTARYTRETILSYLGYFLWHCRDLADLRVKLAYHSSLCYPRQFAVVFPLDLHPGHPGLRCLHLEQVKVTKSELIQILGNPLTELSLSLVGMSTKDDWHQLWLKLLGSCPRLVQLRLFLLDVYDDDEPHSGMANAFAPESLRPLVEAVRARQGRTDICPELRSPKSDPVRAQSVGLVGELSRT